MEKPDLTESNTEKPVRFPQLRFVFRLFFFGSVIGIIIGSLSPASDLGDPSINDKVLHFGAYLIAGFLALQGFRRKQMRLICFASLLFIGCGIEFAQLHVPGRSFDLADMLANAFGATTSFLAARVFSA